MNIKLVILLALNTVVHICTELCRSDIKQGPFTFEQRNIDIATPSKIILKIERIKVVKDVELAVMYRAFWKSFCYNGGALDWNTGCYDSLKQALPSYEETGEWIARQECTVGNDCEDCYGGNSQQCDDPEGHEKRWVKNKELIRAKNNNHFARHTCNISWRCGISIDAYPTFIRRNEDTWVIYTETKNGTELEVEKKDFWTSKDMLLRKTSEPITKTEWINVACFKVNNKYYACYDEQLGNFVEFKMESICMGKTCYRMEQSDIPLEKSPTVKADLHAASIEDLRSIIAIEHMINEELRYNFGLVLEELNEQRNIIMKVILSAAKIDDRLIGVVLGQKAVSKFITEETFFLAPCSNTPKSTSNCRGDTFFKNGRWQIKSTDDQCIETGNSTKIDIMKTKQLWFPDIINQQPTGTADNFEGWTYYANEQENLREAMEWTKNVQQNTSINDIMSYPRGFINNALLGFVSLHTLMYAGCILIAIYLCWRARYGENKRLTEVHNTYIQPVIANRPATEDIEMIVGEKDCNKLETIEMTGRNYNEKPANVKLNWTQR